MSPFTSLYEAPECGGLGSLVPVLRAFGAGFYQCGSETALQHVYSSLSLPQPQHPSSIIGNARYKHVCGSLYGFVPYVHSLLNSQLIIPVNIILLVGIPAHIIFLYGNFNDQIQFC